MKMVSRWRGGRGHGLSKKSAEVHAKIMKSKEPQYHHVPRRLEWGDDRWEVLKYQWKGGNDR